MLQDIVSTPRLSVMETRLRPIDGQVIPRTVRNDGFADAEVTSVSFMPLRGAQFRLTEPLRRDPTRNQVVIQFNADDNQAQQEGRHRNYERTYLLPDIVVPGKDTVEITVEIQNSKHKDWAWNGELTIEYHDGRKIVIPSITAVFVDNAPESA